MSCREREFRTRPNTDYFDERIERKIYQRHRRNHEKSGRTYKPMQQQRTQRPQEQEQEQKRRQRRRLEQMYMQQKLEQQQQSQMRAQQQGPKRKRMDDPSPSDQPQQIGRRVIFRAKRMLPGDGSRVKRMRRGDDAPSTMRPKRKFLRAKRRLPDAKRRRQDDDAPSTMEQPQQQPGQPGDGTRVYPVLSRVSNPRQVGDDGGWDEFLNEQGGDGDLPNGLATVPIPDEFQALADRSSDNYLPSGWGIVPIPYDNSGFEVPPKSMLIDQALKDNPNESPTPFDGDSSDDDDSDSDARSDRSEVPYHFN